MKRLHSSTLALAAAAAVASLVVVGAGLAQEAAVQLKALGGEKVLDSANAAPDVEK